MEWWLYILIYSTGIGRYISRWEAIHWCTEDCTSNLPTCIIWCSLGLHHRLHLCVLHKEWREIMSGVSQAFYKRNSSYPLSRKISFSIRIVTLDEWSRQLSCYSHIGQHCWIYSGTSFRRTSRMLVRNCVYAFPFSSMGWSKDLQSNFLWWHTIPLHSTAVDVAPNKASGFLAT